MKFDHLHTAKTCQISMYHLKVLKQKHRKTISQSIEGWLPLVYCGSPLFYLLSHQTRKLFISPTNNQIKTYGLWFIVEK